MPITLATHAMGTRFELVLDGADARRLRAVGESALRDIAECHQRFNLFDPGSWLNAINHRAFDEPVVLDDLTFELLAVCRRVYDDSGGAFDITVAPLMHALGLHRAEGPASQREIDDAQSRVGMKYVQLDPDARTVRFTKPGVAMDLGAVAKGFAIDLAIGSLIDHGVTCALLHGGTSTAAAIGSPPGEEGWRVAVQNGIAELTQANTTVLLKDSALSVSAPHGRVIESDGKTLGHVLDPRTGRAVACGGFAAALGRSACLTDAWATALLVLGHAPDSLPNSLSAILPAQQEPANPNPANSECVLS
jgi:FAD:protein FMN transferase